MTAYTVNRPTGIIPVDRDAARAGSEAPADTAAADTLEAAPAAGRRTAPQRASQRTAPFPGMAGAPSPSAHSQSTLHSATTTTR
ncbi:MAG: hypothetical protein K2F72_08290 [Muribaculaceae bacterium]|nr:hypothetical protein [Muribaculaceae bacterium]